MRHSTYVGIDTHKDTNAVCALDPETGEVTEAVLGGEPALVVDWIRGGVASGELAEPVLCCYEAGPTGYGLQRALEEAGFECVVAAPSKLPKRADRVKTDRVDAAWLARQLQAGAVRPVWVPPANLEALRSLVSLRCARAQGLARAKQRFRSFALARGIRPPVGGWGARFLAWASSVELDDPADDYVFHELVDEVSRRSRDLGRVEARTAEAVAADPELSAAVRALEALPGVGPALACALVAKVGDASRFERLDSFPSYLGLCPSESSSGKTVRRGGMAKAGDEQLRRLLVQAATCLLRPLRRHAAPPEGVPEARRARGARQARQQGQGRPRPRARHEGAPRHAEAPVGAGGGRHGVGRRPHTRPPREPRAPRRSGEPRETAVRQGRDRAPAARGTESRPANNRPPAATPGRTSLHAALASTPRI